MSELTVPPGLQTFLALDFGIKRTGFAVGNRLMRTAQPKGTAPHAQGQAHGLVAVDRQAWPGRGPGARERRNPRRNSDAWRSARARGFCDPIRNSGAWRFHGPRHSSCERQRCIAGRSHRTGERRLAR